MAKLTKDKKREIVKQITQWINESPATVFVHFYGLNIKDEQKMRNALRQEGVSYSVARKTLIKRALQDAKVEGNMPELEGELSLAFLKEGNDSTAPARNVYKFVEEFGDAVSIIGGVFENQFKTAEEMNEIATIPSQDTLRGMFANVINSPISGLVISLSEIAKTKEA